MSSILLFISMMLPITWSPGPNNIMCATVGGKKGVLKTFPFIVGINIPILIYSLITGFGLGVTLQKAPVLISILQYAGGLYILYLAWKILKSKTDDSHVKKELGFTDGFIISALNAKIITALILMHSQFISSEMDGFSLVLILSISFASLCVLGHFMWATLGALTSKLFYSPRALKIQNIFFSVMLFIVGIWILLAK